MGAKQGWAFCVMHHSVSVNKKGVFMHYFEILKNVKTMSF